MENTVLQIFEHRVNDSGTRPALLYKRNAEWVEQSWREWWEESERIAAALIDLGIEPGESVSILSNTRVEWAWIDMGIAMAGAVVVPVYPSNLPEQVAHILRDAGSRAVFVEDPSQLEKVLEVWDELPDLETVVLLERLAVHESADWRGRETVRLEDVLPEEREDVRPYETLVSRGRRKLAEDSSYVALRRRQIDEHAVASIVYTSGTSGVPKGVVHTHKSFAAEIDALSSLNLLESDDRQLLFLPLAHIFAKVVFLASVGTGIQTAFAESIDQVLKNLRETRPTFFASVPRVFEKIHDQLQRDVVRRPGLRKRIFERAFSRGREFSRTERHGEERNALERVEQSVYDTLVYKRIKRLFGGHIRFLFSGGAPLRPDLAEFFHAAGILLLEGYGLTETAAVSTLNLPNDFRFGSVGKPLPNVDVTIDEDGEILVRGDSVMREYHGMPEETEEAIESDTGWFHTGDRGKFDRDGFLHITGRKKQLIVTAGGKNVPPASIERKLIESDLISGAVLYGDGRAFISALIAPSKQFEHWAAGKGIPFDSMEDLVERHEIVERMQREVDRVNKTLPSFESVRRFALTSRPFLAEEGEVTPTGKLRRDRIIENHHDALDALYDGE
ncbi:MAG: AMP-dependent synthetase/ligase [Myxococcota bacterium]